MKKQLIFLVLLVLPILSAKAQNYTDTTDSLLQFLDKKTMQTDILYDRVFPFANLMQPKDTSNFEYFRQAYSELYRASYQPISESVYSLYVENNNTRELQTMPIGLLDVAFEIFDTTKIEKRDGLIYSKKNTPFLKKEVSLIAPLKKWVATTSLVQFSLAIQLLQNERGVSKLEVSFDREEFVTWIANGKRTSESLRYNYESSGKKYINFTVTFDDGTVINHTAEIDVRLYNENQTDRLNSFPLEEDFIGNDKVIASIPFQGYNELSSSSGELEYRVYYNLRDNDGTRQSIIKKPVIVLDGFDPGDIRKIYEGSIGYNNEEPNNTIYNLMRFTRSIRDTVSLVDLLRSPEYGYDVILVNFPEGADYIERNAMAVVTLLDTVNARLRRNYSTEEIVLIGPSMGGLISRYALTYMEKNNMEHNTRLWISFDSPHLGANIPISIQQTLVSLGYRAGQESAKEKFELNFASPAARQMLIEQTTSFLSVEALGYPGGMNHTSPFRQKFMESLNSNGGERFAGFPDRLRKVALINGTTWGRNVHPAGLKYLDMEGRVAGLRVAELETRFLGLPGTTVQTLKLRVSNPLFALPWPFVGFSQYVTRIDTKNVNPNGSMDVVQGGTYNPQADIVQEFTTVLEEEGVDYDWHRYEKNHSFIPSVSSLALLDGYKRDWSKPINRDLVCSSETPFDSYYSPDTNEEHVKITASSVEWLLKEIQGNPQPPRYTFTENDFVFSTDVETICVGDKATLKAVAEECKFSSEIKWSVSSNLDITYEDGFSVEVKANSSGEAFITATFESGQTYTKMFWVGEPQLDPLVECDNNQDGCWSLCKSTAFSIGNEIRINTFGNLNQNVVEWEWEKTTTNFSWITNGNTAYFATPHLGFIAFRVRARNECGWSKWQLMQMDVRECKDNSELRTENLFKIYPNPTSYLLNIELDNPKNAFLIDKTEVGIYDLVGKLRKTIKLTGFKGQIYVNDLPKGLYILKILIDGQLETHQVQID